jgi:hypothetical protein
MSWCPDCDKLTGGRCALHTTQVIGLTPSQVTQAMRCPVCEGRGYVPNGFYGSYAGCPWTVSSLEPETCKSCGGKGYVTI